MNDESTSLEDEWQPFRNLFASKSNIQILEIIDTSPLASELNQLAREASFAEQELSVCLAHYSNIHASAKWIEEILSVYEIKGIFYFCLNTNEILEKSPAWVKVNLGDNYHWVYPLWEVNHRVRSLAFIPLDVSYYLEFTFSEGYYRAYLSYQRHILTRKKELDALRQQDYGAFYKAIDSFDPRDYD